MCDLHIYSQSNGTFPWLRILALLTPFLIVCFCLSVLNIVKDIKHSCGGIILLLSGIKNVTDKKFA